MASVSIYDIWRHGLAAVTTLAEAAEAGDESPRRRRLLSMAKEMLASCPLGVDDQPPSVGLNQRWMLLTDCAAGYLDLRRDHSLRGDAAMTKEQQRVIRDALTIAVALEPGNLNNKAKHINGLREAFGIDWFGNVDNNLLPDLILSYRKIFEHCSGSWWRTKGGTRRHPALAVRKRKRRLRKRKDSANDVAQTADSTGYEVAEMESPEFAEYVSDWNYASTSAAELGEGAEYSDWVLQVLAAGLENTTWLDTVRLEDAGRLDASCLHEIRDHGSERLGITSLPPSEDHQSRLLEHTSAPGPDEVPMPLRLCCEWLGDPPWSL